MVIIQHISRIKRKTTQASIFYSEKVLYKIQYPFMAKNKETNKQKNSQQTWSKRKLPHLDKGLTYHKGHIESYMIWTVIFPTSSLYTLICSFIIRCTAFLAVAQHASMFPPLGLCINCFLCPECISFYLLFFFFLNCITQLEGTQFQGQGLNLDPQQWKHGVQTPGTSGNSPECFWIRQLYGSFHLFLHFLDQMSHSYCVLPSVSSVAQSCPTLCHP